MFERRGILVHPEELDEIWLEDIHRAGINVLGLHPVGGKEADQTLRKAIERHGTMAFQALLSKARAMGIEVEYEAHALRYLLPEERFSEHPEWFRMDENGARTTDFNMCASNEEALDELTKQAAALTRALDTGSRRHFWWADDVKGHICCCPECRKLSASDQLMRITNAIHRGVRKVQPDGMTAFLAYCDTVKPPETVMPEEGVFLEYAPIQRDSHRPINDPDCEKNAAETEGLEQLIAFFGRKHSQVLEYWVDNSRFSGWKKPPKYMELDERVMRADVRFYKELGFESVTSFGCYLGADYRALYGKAPVMEYGNILAGK